MDKVSVIEDRRMVLQESRDASRTRQDRNLLGQFATPKMLAADILEYARLLVPPTTTVRFLDPAFGTGSFYSALQCSFPAEHISAATGIEIDPHYGLPARELWQGYPLELCISDFTQASPPQPAEQYNLIVCNPPYVRHHHINIAEKRRLQHATTKACGVHIGGLAGLYCYFIGLAHAWLADDGIACWLIPSEFMDVNYGQALKTYLLDEVELLRIHRFAPGDLQFTDALVSSAVVWFRKRCPSPNHIVEFTYGGSHARPTHTRTVPAAALKLETKWTRFPVKDVRSDRTGPKLADFFRIQRGLVTGDNKFFILTRDQIKMQNLPFEFFKPILPGPRFVPMDEIETETDGTPRIERQLYILDCKLSEVEINRLYPNLATYLETGKPAVSERYVCRYRSPWYSQEKRPPAPFICTYMGRNLKKGRPIRFILNRSQATAANVYLMLYPKDFVARVLESEQGLARQVWSALNDIDLQSLLSEGRVYGGGLYKMEPKELANVSAVSLVHLFPAHKFPEHENLQPSLWPTDEI